MSYGIGTIFYCRKKLGSSPITKQIWPKLWYGIGTKLIELIRLKIFGKQQSLTLFNLDLWLLLRSPSIIINKVQKKSRELK